MIKQVIDAIIDSYEQRLINTRDDLTRTSDMLTAMTEKYEQVAVANIGLTKENATLQRGLTAEQEDKRRAVEHLIAAVSCIPAPTGNRCATASTSALRDAWYPVPADAATAFEQTHIDPLVDALDKREGG